MNFALLFSTLCRAKGNHFLFILNIVLVFIFGLDNVSLKKIVMLTFTQEGIVIRSRRKWRIAPH